MSNGKFISLNKSGNNVKVVVVYFQALFRHLRGRTKENGKKHQ